jgi:class 3 adenylate cyclase
MADIPRQGGPGAGPAMRGIRRLRPWERLSVRLALFFAAVTFLAVGAVGALTYTRQQREVEDGVGTQLLNIARVAALQLDPRLHAEADAARSPESPAYQRLRQMLAAIQDETLLTSPITTLADVQPAARTARLVVASSGPGRPGDAYSLAPELIEPMGWTLGDGVARYTRVYRHQGGLWISAFAPILDARGRPGALLHVAYPVEIYLDRLHELRDTLLLATGVGALATLGLGLLVLRRLTRPIALLTGGVARVADGDLSRPLPVTSKDEVGRLTQAFNTMLDGLRQRDFIRSAFGRYVSPEVAQAILESPEGLRFGGTKRRVTVLMSDLRGYTRFAEQGEPAEVMEILNGYLARMADVVIAHGGTINEFIGDAIFAVYGAPVAHPDHAERAAATALAMQAALAEVNAEHARRGLPAFEMGIGLHTGEAVVGNIGSEQRAKYAVVGSAVNVASRVESATVGGQILLTAATLAELGALAQVGPPVALTVKGLAEPLTLHSLTGLGGRFARTLPAAAPEAERQTAVELPLECWVVDGKVVRPDGVRGRVVRLGRREVHARLDTPPDPFTNVRLRLRYPPPIDRDSEAIYAKVLDRDAAGLVRMRLTALGPADEEAIETLLGQRAGRGDFTPS